VLSLKIFSRNATGPVEANNALRITRTDVSTLPATVLNAVGHTARSARLLRAGAGLD
jgi:hypothetical protein